MCTLGAGRCWHGKTQRNLFGMPRNHDVLRGTPFLGGPSFTTVATGGMGRLDYPLASGSPKEPDRLDKCGL